MNALLYDYPSLHCSLFIRENVSRLCSQIFDVHQKLASSNTRGMEPLFSLFYPYGNTGTVSPFGDFTKVSFGGVKVSVGGVTTVSAGGCGSGVGASDPHPTSNAGIRNIIYLRMNILQD